MKKILISLCSLFLVVTASAQQKNQAYLDYIEKYSSIAVSEQAKFGIPASITLAQGLLESGAGQSELARKSNNHFGIKCHTGWTGERTYHDDDARQECFRKYQHVSESYDDHSLFLTSRSRYADLFKLKPTDYKGWAHGLKKAGYATDPNYANKLIKIIEDYDLHQLDVKGKIAGSGVSQPAVSTEKQEKTSKKGKSGSQRESVMGEIPAYTPHPVARLNGVKCVIAESGDSYSSIASEFGITEKEILRFNDVTKAVPLQKGDRVYLGMKKNRASKQNASYTVKEGDSAHAISQRYGIRLKKLYDLNEMNYSKGVQVGQRLRLR
ncbi:MAG: glucosaminidase domain-containing protein [Paludibacteraceae bacterium]|nr:glucosaminidase domain-containing protein [Paludibacteraceae bacterium]